MDPQRDACAEHGRILSSGQARPRQRHCVVQLSTVLAQEKTEMKFKKTTCTIALAMLLSLQPVLAQHAASGTHAATSSVEDPLLKARASAKADKAELKAAKGKLKADKKANADKSVIAADEARIKAIEQDLQDNKASARVEMQRRAIPAAI